MPPDDGSSPRWWRRACCAARRLLRRRRREHAAGRLALAAGSTLGRDADGTHVTLVVERGCVWATCSGDPSDHLLRTGESLRIPRRARLALQVIADATVEIRHRGGEPCEEAAACASA